MGMAAGSVLGMPRSGQVGQAGDKWHCAQGQER